MNPRTRSAKTSSHAHQVVESFTKNPTAVSIQNSKRSFRHLYQKLYPESAQADSVALDHFQAEDSLPEYVSDEQHGSDVHRVYPLIWEHLQTCEECREIYNLFVPDYSTPVLVHRVLQAQAPSTTPGTEPQFSAWSSVENKQANSIVFTFSPKYIQAICSRPTDSLSLRGLDNTTQSLFISDSIQRGKSQLLIHAWLEPIDERRTTFNLRLQTTPPRFAGLLKPKLYWNNKQYTPKRAGQDLLFQNLESPRKNDTLLSAPYGSFALEFRLGDKKQVDS